MGQLFWDIFCFLLWATQLLRLFRHLKRSKCIILCYGGITDNHKKTLSWNTDGRYLDKKRFEHQIQYIKKHYRLIPLSEIAESLEVKKLFPVMSVALTFDYGYSCTYTNALAPLAEDKVPYGLSLVTDFVEKKGLIWHDRLELAIHHSRNRDLKVKIGGFFIDEKIKTPRQKARTYMLLKSIAGLLDVQKRDMLLAEIENQLQFSSNEAGEIPEDCSYMTANQIAEVAAYDAEIGSQTSHLVDLARISRRDLVAEAYESKLKITRISGKECTFFVYPLWRKGTPDEIIMEIIEKSGYSCALTSVPGFIQPGANSYALPRITVSGNDSFFAFAAKLAGIGIRRNLS